MTDPWDFWRRARMEPGRIGSADLPLHPDSPEVGFWRYFDKRADRWIPVAYWLDDDGMMMCARDGDPVEPMKMGDLWHRVCRHPISFLEYQRATDGKGFADEPPAIVIGHNLSEDLAEQLRLEYEAEMEIAAELLAKEITSQDIADQIAIMAARLSKLRGRADDEHTREKRPHLEAGREVDDRWRFRETVTESLGRLKKHLQPWLDSHEASAGRTGARVSLRSFTVGFITDYDLFIENVKHRADVAQFFEALATKLAKSGTALGGMEIREEKRAV
jgi:hypothetical protein